MVRKEYTTISISLDVKHKLDSLKVHPRQSYDEVLGMILDRLNNE